MPTKIAIPVLRTDRAPNAPNLASPRLVTIFESGKTHSNLRMSEYFEKMIHFCLRRQNATQRVNTSIYTPLLATDFTSWANLKTLVTEFKIEETCLFFR